MSRPYRHKWCYVAFVLIILLGGALGGFQIVRHVPLLRTLFLPPQEVRSLAEVERIIHAQFPPSAHLVRAKEAMGMLMAVVDMDRHDLDRMLASEAFRGPVTDKERLLHDQSFFAFQGVLPEWQPDDDRTFIAAKHWDEQRQAMTYLQASLDHKPRVRVYLAWQAF